MHHDRVTLRHFQSCSIHLISRNVILQRDLLPREALGLHAQQHDDVRTSQGVLNMARYAKPWGESCRHLGHELRRTAERDLHTESRKQVTSAASYPAMEDVSDDGGMKTIERLFVSENGDCIQQRLRWMFVHPIARVDDGNVDVTGHEVRCSRRRMPHHNAIRAHSTESVSGIDDRLPFLNARTGSMHEHRRGI